MPSLPSATENRPAVRPGLDRARGGWTARRLASVASGVVLAVISLGILAAGGLLAAGGVDVGLGAHGRYHTAGYALVSDGADWRTELFGSVGSVRLRAAADGSRPIFVGVAGGAAVNRYLAGVSHTTVHEGGGMTPHAGAAPARPPALAVAWTAAASGNGVQTLRWDRGGGRQVVVAMNADGSPSVGARVVSETATLRARPAVAAAALAAAAVLLALSVVLVGIPARRARTAPPA